MPRHADGALGSRVPSDEGFLKIKWWNLWHLLDAVHHSKQPTATIYLQAHTAVYIEHYPVNHCCTTGCTVVLSNGYKACRLPFFPFVVSSIPSLPSLSPHFRRKALRSVQQQDATSVFPRSLVVIPSLSCLAPAPRPRQ